MFLFPSETRCDKSRLSFKKNIYKIHLQVTDTAILRLVRVGMRLAAEVMLYTEARSLYSNGMLQQSHGALP